MIAMLRRFMALLLRSDNGWSAISPENRDPLFRIALKAWNLRALRRPKRKPGQKDRAHLTRCGAIYSEIAKKQWVVEWISTASGRFVCMKLSQLGGFWRILPAPVRIRGKAGVMARKKRPIIAEIRSIFARLLAAGSGSADPRLERAF